MALYLTAILRARASLKRHIWVRASLPTLRPLKAIPNLASSFVKLELNSPLSETSDNLLSRADLGSLILSNRMKPLSMPSWPIFFPQSPIVMPGRGSKVYLFLSGTTNPWTPLDFPSMMSWQKTIEMVALLAAPPIQNFIASRLGVLRMNCLACLS